MTFGTTDKDFKEIQSEAEKELGRKLTAEEIEALKRVCE